MMDTMPGPRPAAPRKPEQRMNVTHGTGVLPVGQGPERQGTHQPLGRSKYTFPSWGGRGNVPCYYFSCIKMKTFPCFQPFLKNSYYFIICRGIPLLPPL